MSAAIEHRVRERKAWRIGTLAVASLLIAAFWFGRQVFQADWGIIDDHEVFEYLGTSRSLALGDVLKTVFTQTELANPWSNVRFRPVYYVLRVFEVALWGDRVQLWYMARLLLYAVFLFAVAEVTARLCGFITALILMIYVSLFGYWGDVFARLGPAEAYATAGLGLWLLGIRRLLGSQPLARKRLALFAVFAGAAIMSGSKETLVPFSFYSVAAILISIWLDGTRDRTASMVALVASCGWGAMIAVIMLHQLASHGTDIYGASAAFGDRAKLVAGALRALVWPVAAAGALIATFYLIAPWDKWLRASGWLLAVVAVVASLHASQFIAYNGQWPTRIRYDFPGQMCLPALWVAVVAYAGALDLGAPDTRRLRQAVLLVAMIILQARFGVGEQSVNPGLILSRVGANISATATFSSGIRDVIAQGRAHPERPIVLEAHGIGSYEPVFSTGLYLRHYKVTNPVTVRYHLQDSDRIGKAQEDLANVLVDLERKGATSKYGRFWPLSGQMEAIGKGCISVALYGPGDATCFARRVF